MKKGGKQQQSHIYQIFIPVLFSKITKDDFLKINFKVFQNSSKKKKKKSFYVSFRILLEEKNFISLRFFLLCVLYAYV